MSTTQLFVELLVIGIGVSIWLVLLISSILGHNFISPFENINSLYAFPVIGISYVLGIVVDRIGYKIFNRINQRYKEEQFKDITSKLKEEVQNIEKYILINYTSLHQRVTYNRSRLRICRSWIINFALITIFSIPYIIRISPSKVYLLIFIPLINFLFCGLTIYAFCKLANDYYIYLKESYIFLKENDSGNYFKRERTQNSSK